MDDSIDINGIALSDDNDYNSYDEDDESLSDINEEASDDCCTAKQSDSRIESLIEEQSVQSPHPKQQSERMKTIKQRYTRRISLIEMTGILCESYNSLQRGRIPLLNNLSDETFKKHSLVETMFMEIEQGNCPIVIQKNGELLSLSDFDQKGVMYHLSYIKSIWKVQHKL
ncbi:DNA-directed RNA polymerase 19 kDa subunit [Finch poxvirus]|uniref:DNA-directed RNA polymerase 19 kDa subunit n=2 Tax=unclassified Avipoxvirus TaxID=336487 RepID=A0AAT9UQT8_9POXV|nr:DNA-directed RNA polymerase 19 kDa subunit [Finch poxvirus]UOX39013.1 DNA-directed RNA polymerase 19 kDa subunit [Finch poxvirus]